MFHHCKALLLQKSKLGFLGIMKIHTIRLYQRKSKKADIPSGRDLIVELPHRAAAQISGILVFCLCICDLPVDLLKITVGDHRFSPQDQFSGIGNIQRKILKSTGVICNDLTDLSVATGNRFCKFSFTIRQYNGQPVQFPAENCRIALQPVPQFFPAFRLAQRQHRTLMALLGKLIHRFVAYVYRRTVGQGNACLFFQFHQFIIELVVFVVAHDLLILGVIAFGSCIQLFYQIFDPVYFGRLHLVFLPLYI